MVHMFILLPGKAMPAFTLHSSTLPCFPNVQRFVRRNFKPFHNFQSWQLDRCLPSASCRENKLPFPLLSLIPIPRNFRMFCVLLQSFFPPGNCKVSETRSWWNCRFRNGGAFFPADWPFVESHWVPHSAEISAQDCKLLLNWILPCPTYL